jgi:hypothetical protein
MIVKAVPHREHGKGRIDKDGAAMTDLVER